MRRATRRAILSGETSFKVRTGALRSQECPKSSKLEFSTWGKIFWLHWSGEPQKALGFMLPKKLANGEGSNLKWEISGKVGTGRRLCKGWSRHQRKTHFPLTRPYRRNLATVRHLPYFPHQFKQFYHLKKTCLVIKTMIIEFRKPLDVFPSRSFKGNIVFEGNIGYP